VSCFYHQSYTHEKGEGALHIVNNLFNSTKAANTTWFGGTALAIAYTSDVKAVKPSDMTIISVNTVSPWFRNTDYKIPAGLPACPEGGCLCTWNWIHQANHGEGYPYELVGFDVSSWGALP
jgi:hypothetical protein